MFGDLNLSLVKYMSTILIYVNWKFHWNLAYQGAARIIKDNTWKVISDVRECSQSMEPSRV